MELEQAMENRRSIRKYEAKPVETEKIRKMIQAAGLAPSWKNSQVTRYYVAQSEEAVAKVREALPEFNRNNTENAPVLITTTIVKDRSGYNMDGSPTNELGNGWGYYDCGLQNMNLLLKAEELGLSTLIMGIRDAEKLRDVFHIPPSKNSCVTGRDRDVPPDFLRLRQLKVHAGLNFGELSQFRNVPLDTSVV